VSRRRKANLYLRDRIWWCWFYDHRGKRIRRSTCQKVEALARTAAFRIEAEYIENPPEANGVTLEKAVSEYLASCERQGGAESTLEFYLRKWKPLRRLLGATTPVNKITMEMIEEYADQRERAIKQRRPKSTRAIATVGKELGLLRSALRYLAKQRGPDGRRLYARDPGEIFPSGFIGNYKPRDRALSLAEYHKLYLALSPLRRVYLQAFCGLGARDSELYRITPSDLDEPQGTVRIPGTKTAGSERWLQPPDELLGILRERAAATDFAEPLFPLWKNVRRDLRAACKRASIPPVSPNDLRRTFASWQAEAGVPEGVTASLLGHTSSAMVRRVYAKIGTEAKRAAMAKLPPLTPPDCDVDRDKPEAQMGPMGRSDAPAAQPTNEEAPPEARLSVPRDGIEPPTRGFSNLTDVWPKPGKSRAIRHAAKRAYTPVQQTAGIQVVRPRLRAL
jgi:integrase